MRLLITNDDGINAEGLHVLARHLLGCGHRLTVAAPLTDRSGSASSLGSVVHGALVATTVVKLDGLEQVDSLAVDAPPAFIVRAACLGVFGPAPEAVISGINPGHNSGRIVLHSGTLGAAMTAVSMGVPGIAVSCGARPGSRFDTAAEVLVSCLARLADNPQTALNLNVPDVDIGDVKGIREVRLSEMSSTEIELVRDGNAIRVHRHSPLHPDDPEGDTALIRRGYATISRVIFGSAGDALR